MSRFRFPWVHFALSLLFSANTVLAACSGQDLRPTLTKQERKELHTALANRPYSVGNHWQARRGDEVLHLVGTVHLEDARLSDPIARLKPLIERASLVLLEMTAAERTELQKAMGARPDLLLLDNTSLPELMVEDDWQRLANAMRARGLPPFIASRFQPWYVSMLLSLPPCLAESMVEANGLDARIERIADESNVPTSALEPFDTGFKAFDSVPLDTQIDMLRASLTPSAAAEDMFATVMSSYLDQAHGESWYLAQILAARFGSLPEETEDAVFSVIEKKLLDNRNHAWIDVIEGALHDTEGMVFVAFGAGHLGGDNGVLKLLEDAGFTLERRPF